MIERSVAPCCCGHRRENHWHITRDSQHPEQEGRYFGCGIAGCGCAEYSVTVRNFPAERYAARSASLADDAVRLGAEGNEIAAALAAELAEVYSDLSMDYAMRRVA